MSAVLATVLCGALLWLMLWRGSPFRLPARWIGWDYYRPCAGNWAEARAAGCANDHPSKRRPMPQQPINTWSNLAYVYAGAVSGDPAFATLMMILGLSSALYHATSTTWAGRLDVNSMYSTLLFLILAAFLPSGYAAAGAAGFGIAIGVWWYRDLLQKIGGFFVVGVGVNVTCLVLTHTPPWWLLAGLAAFGLAHGAWQLDQRCRFPRTAGHGVWHVLTAIGFWCLWRSLQTTGVS